MSAAAAVPGRSSPRFNTELAVVWQSPAGIGGEGAVRDVSAGGAFVQPKTRTGTLEVGDYLRFLIEIPNERSMEVWVAVRWKGRSLTHQCSGFGVEFMGRHPLLTAALS
ncbi:MAG: PilZ domain-containing protein [Deltaproteobacteria bacterium]|nr:PilZ domain-containing protein [Deltaproteobacteria bacterium]